MKQLIRLLLALLPCLSFSCDYAPSGTHYEDIDPHPKGTASVTLDMDKDTIAVRGIVNMTFNLFLPGRQYYGHKLYLDNNEVAAGVSPKEPFHFDSERFADGYHVLKYVAYANSGTGSLADKAGAEVLQVLRTWVVFIDNAAPTPVGITSINSEDGQLRINWPAYKGRWFKKLELRRQIGEGREVVVLSTTDQNTGTWLDNSYVGGQAYYKVVVYLEGTNYTNTNSVTYGPTAIYNYPLPTALFTSYNEQGESLVTFSSTPFYKNFKSYVLSSNDSFFEITGRTDTVKVFPTPNFGRNIEWRLTTYPKDYNIFYDQEAFTTVTTLPGTGYSWGPFPDDAVVHRIPSLDRFLVWHYGTLSLVDTKSMRVLQVRHIGYTQPQFDLALSTVSANGQHAYIALNNVIHKLDLSTLLTEKVTYLGDVLSFTDYSRFGLSVSNNNRLMIAAHNNWTNIDTVYLVDMEHRKVLTKIKSDIIPSASYVHPDGNAMRVSQHIYLQKSDNSWEAQPHSSIYTYGYVFHPAKPLYALKKDTEITFYSTVTGAKEKSITTEYELYDYAVDAASGYLHGISEKFNGDRTLYIYNIETGALVRKVPLARSVSAFLYKDRIFSHERYIML